MQLVSLSIIRKPVCSSLMLLPMFPDDLCVTPAIEKKELNRDVSFKKYKIGVTYGPKNMLLYNLNGFCTDFQNVNECLMTNSSPVL